LTVGSSYNPIGLKENNEIQIGRVYDGLLVQWNTQGNNNSENIYANVRQRPNNEKKKWVSNKIKFNYILKNWKEAVKIIKEDEYKVISPLKIFLEKNTYDEDEDEGLNNLNNLLNRIYNSKHYLDRAYDLFEYLYIRNYNIDGYNLLNDRNNSNKYNSIEFITHSKFKYNGKYHNKVGTFLSPIYALYIYINEIKSNKLKKKLARIKSEKEKRKKSKKRAKSGNPKLTNKHKK
jgi:hypothetical protein